MLAVGLVSCHLYADEVDYAGRVTLTGLLHDEGGVVVVVPPPAPGARVEAVRAQCCDLYDAELALGHLAGESYRVDVIRRLLQTVYPQPRRPRVQFVESKC